MKTFKPEFYQTESLKRIFKPMTIPTIPRNRKKELRSWPIEQFATGTEPELARLAEHLALHKESEWFLDQLLHQFGGWKLIWNGDLIDCLATVKHNVVSDFDRGCWQLACRTTRSKLVARQIDQPNFSSLVPLILAGVKRYQEVAYSSWDAATAECVMPRDLWEATRVSCDLDSEELLQLRVKGLQVQTGARAGTSRDPKSSWQLYGIADSELGRLPKLAQVMYAQIWVAHPDLRHRDMILDPENWDTMPEPLIKTDVVTKWTAMPWEQ